MPYMSPQRVKEIRTQIKKEFPKFKFSVRTRHHSTVVIDILSGPIDMLVTDHSKKYGYDKVNHFYITDHYEKYPEVRDVLLRLKEIANEGNAIQFIDGDYGAIPEFYVSISIGNYDNHYRWII